MQKSQALGVGGTLCKKKERKRARKKKHFPLFYTGPTYTYQNVNLCVTRTPQTKSTLKFSLSTPENKLQETSTNRSWKKMKNAQ